MLNKLVCGFLIGGLAASTSAQTFSNIQANSPYSAYSQDFSGSIVRSSFGFCWRTSYWTPADAVAGCDGVLAPPVAKAIAPAFVAAPDPMPVSAAVSQTSPTTVSIAIVTTTTAPTPKRCDFSSTLASNQAFAFNNAQLSDVAKKYIHADVLPKLASCAKIDTLVIIGHTDRIGSSFANHKLSEARAQAVSAYLKTSGVTTAIDARGAGDTQPLSHCGQKLSHKQLVECLTPDRRVTIEARGTQK